MEEKAVILSENVMTDIANAIREKEGTTDLIKPAEMADKIENLPSGPEPTGKKEITTTEEVDVANYATAQVVDENLIAKNIKSGVSILGVEGTGPNPSGTYIISDTEVHDVIDYANARVEDLNLSAGNIKSGVSILGVLGNYEPSTIPDDGLYIDQFLMNCGAEYDGSDGSVKITGSGDVAMLAIAWTDETKTSGMLVQSASGPIFEPSSTYVTYCTGVNSVSLADGTDRPTSLSTVPMDADLVRVEDDEVADFFEKSNLTLVVRNGSSYGSDYYTYYFTADDVTADS